MSSIEVGLTFETYIRCPPLRCFVWTFLSVAFGFCLQPFIVSGNRHHHIVTSRFNNSKNVKATERARVAERIFRLF